MAGLQQIYNWLKDHPAITLALAPGLLGFVKITTAARFILSSQLAIASKSDALDILTGTLVTLVPGVAALMMVGSILAFRSSDALAKNFGFLGIVMSGFVLAYIPIVNRLLPAAVALGAVAGVVQILFGQRDRIERALATLCLMLLVSTATTGVWLPVEVIQRSDGETIVGFVLDERADPVPVLVNQDRTVLLVPKSEINTRNLCRTRDLSRSLADVVLRRDQVANRMGRCPDSATTPLP